MWYVIGSGVGTAVLNWRWADPPLGGDVGHP
eukprot:COSAG03_NODE_29081_length_190_cov_75.373626_1_plen_30_part_01